MLIGDVAAARSRRARRAPRTCSSGLLDGAPARASSCASERTKTPISWGRTPSSTRVADPVADSLDLLVLVVERRGSSGGGPLKTETVPRRSSALPSTSAIARAEQAVGLRADLVRGAVVDAQGARAAADVDAERLPGERLLEDALAEVAGEEEGVRAVRRRARRGSAAAATLRSCASSTTAKSKGAFLLPGECVRQRG